MRREFETLFRSQAERILRDLDVVQREDFEAVKDMARLAREENEALKARVAALEAALGKAATSTRRRRRTGGAVPRRAPILERSPARPDAVISPARSLFFNALRRYKRRHRGSQHPWRLPRNSITSIRA